MTERTTPRWTAGFGSLYEGVLNGSVSFNSSYRSLIDSGYSLYGSKRSSYLLTPSSNSTTGYDGILLLSGQYDEFTGDHSKNGLTGGEIEEVSFYKNVDLTEIDGNYYSGYFRKEENHIVTIPLYGMSLSEFYGKLQSTGNYSNPETLLKELFNDRDWFGGYSSTGSTVVDSFGGDDSVYIDDGVQYARGGDGNDLFEGTPSGAALIDGGRGDDVFNGSSGSGDPSKQYLWVGGSGQNKYIGPELNTVVVVSQKSQSQTPDIISYADLVLATPDQKTGYVVIETSNPDANQLDLRFVDQPLLDKDGNKVHSAGYFSVLYKGVEQIRINPFGGGWDLDGFLAERDTYENNIRAAIAVASMDQLIVPGEYSDVALQEIKQDFSLSSIPNRSTVDLTGQTLLDKSDYVSIGSRFFLKEIKQNSSTNQLELIFNEDVGSIGSAQIYKLDGFGNPIKGPYSFSTYPEQIIDGNKVITSISSDISDDNASYIAVLTTGWTSKDNNSLEGQGDFTTSGVQTYTFSYERDTTSPTIKSISKNSDHQITVLFSEPIFFGDDSPSTVAGYLSTKQNPSSYSDIAFIYKVEDAYVNGSQVIFTTETPPDGDFYFTPTSFKDATENYLHFDWSDAQLLTFEDPAAAANRVKIDLSKDNSFIIPANIFWKDQYQNTGRHDGSSIFFVWELDGNGSSSIGGSYYPFQDHSTYIHSFNQYATPIQITVDDFESNGVYKLSSITIDDIDDGSGSYHKLLSRYDTPEEINQLLESWDLPKGSLDLEIEGSEGLTFAPELTSLKLNKIEINLDDPDQLITGEASYFVDTGSKYYDKSLDLKRLYLRYTDDSGYSISLTADHENLASNEASATFKLDPYLNSYTNPGTYILNEADISWRGGSSLNQDLSKDQLLKLGVPETLTVTGTYTAPANQSRRLVDLQIDQPNVVIEGVEETARFVTATVEVEQFDPQMQTYLDESIEISFKNSSWSNELSESWSGRLSDSLAPVAFNYNPSTKKALVHFQGQIDIKPYQYNGEYIIDSITLGGQYINGGGQSRTRLQQDDLASYNLPPVVVLGATEKSNEPSLSLRDIDPIISEIPESSTQPLSINLDRTIGSQKIDLNIYVSEDGLSPESLPNSNIVVDIYGKLLFRDNYLAENQLIGWFVLESPSGYNTKLVPINFEDKVQPESSWSSSYPTIAKYAPTVEFTREDEPGTWRLTTFVQTHPHFGSTNSAPNLFISANTTDYHDGEASAISTEVVASRLGMEPHRLVVDVINSSFDPTTQRADFQVNPVVSDFKINFSSSSLAAGDSQTLSITLDSDHSFADLTKDQFYSIGIELGHVGKHIVNYDRSDFSIFLNAADVLAEIKLGDGQYQTTFDHTFAIPENFYGGQYVVRSVKLNQDLASSGSQSFNPQFKRFKTFDESNYLLESFQSRSSTVPSQSRSLWESVTVSLISDFTESDFNFYQNQFDQFYRSGFSESNLSFKLSGPELDDSFLNPQTAFPELVFANKSVDLSAKSPSVDFEVSFDYMQTLWSSRYMDQLFVNVADRDSIGKNSYLHIANVETGQTFVSQQAELKSTVSKDGRLTYTFTPDEFIPTGSYRIIHITPNDFSGAYGDFWLDGISDAECKILDETIGESSSIQIINPYATATTSSLTMQSLQFVESTEKSSSIDPITGQSFNLDVDGDGQVTPLGDGLMVIRKLIGPAFADDALTNKARSNDATLSTDEIHENIQKAIDSGALDVDGDGKTTPLGDGLMIIRNLIGPAFAGNALISKAMSAESPYFGETNAADLVTANIEALMPPSI